VDDTADVGYRCISLAPAREFEVRDFFTDFRVLIGDVADGLASVVCRVSGNGAGHVDDRYASIAGRPYVTDLAPEDHSQPALDVVAVTLEGMLLHGRCGRDEAGGCAGADVDLGRLLQLRRSSGH